MYFVFLQRIPTKELVDGSIGGHSSVSAISPQEQFRIAKMAVEEDDYHYAAQWLKHLARFEYKKIIIY
jgi:hypothetical protein